MGPDVIRIAFDRRKPSGLLRLKDGRLLYEQDGHLFDGSLRWVSWAVWVIRDDMTFDEAYEYVVATGHRRGAPMTNVSRYQVHIIEPFVRPGLPEPWTAMVVPPLNWEAPARPAPRKRSRPTADVFWHEIAASGLCDEHQVFAPEPEDEDYTGIPMPRGYLRSELIELLAGR